jgi:hypothetical protein
MAEYVLLTVLLEMLLAWSAQFDSHKLVTMSNQHPIIAEDICQPTHGSRISR